MGWHCWRNRLARHRLGGHDPAGEALVDFQRELKALTRRGILLAIVSKNEESVAMEAIAKHPEMVLKMDDFAGWRINWRDKAENIIALMTELNLGLDSAVFIDDSAVERARVTGNLTWAFCARVAVRQATLSASPAVPRLFRSPVPNRGRSATFSDVGDRSGTKGVKTELGNLEEWLATLKTSVRVEELNPGNLPRAAQLLNKTNQMNLSTRRMSEADFQAWVRKDGAGLGPFAFQTDLAIPG